MLEKPLSNYRYGHIAYIFSAQITIDNRGFLHEDTALIFMIWPIRLQTSMNCCKFRHVFFGLKGDVFVKSNSGIKRISPFSVTLTFFASSLVRSCVRDLKIAPVKIFLYSKRDDLVARPRRLMC